MVKVPVLPARDVPVGPLTAVGTFANTTFSSAKVPAVVVVEMV
jgi:hypothetical protein